MRENSCYHLIRSEMECRPTGTVYALKDFEVFGTSTAVRTTLSRLTKEGFCKRILPGLYYRPAYSKLLKREVIPVSHDVARALARNYDWTILPSPVHAQNGLGISTQVPARVEYTSTGPSRTYMVGNIPIHFRHSRSKYMSKMSYSSAVVTNAFQGLKDMEIEDDMLSVVASRLTDEEKGILKTELCYAPVWMRSNLMEIAAR